MKLTISPTGQIQAIYAESIDLRALGPLAVSRASHVEPDPTGNWLTDLSPVGGPILGPYELRSDALAAELRWLEEHWLTQPALGH